MTKKDENTFANARRLPSAIEVEKMVLGAILLDDRRMAEVAEILFEDCFFDVRHKKIFAAMLDLFAANEPIDTVTLFEKLRKNETLDIAGGAATIAELTQGLSSAANVVTHSRLVFEKWILRSLISLSASVSEKCYAQTNDVVETFAEIEDLFMDVSGKIYRENYSHIRDILKRGIELMESVKLRQTDFLLPSGFYDYDEVIGGFRKKNLYIIAARPSMGKTALMLNMALNLAESVPVGVFSLEMSAEELGFRALSGETHINAFALMSGKFANEDAADITRSAHRISKKNIFIDDTPGLTTLEFKSKAMRLCREQRVKALFVDYLQLMVSPNAQSREREISEISATLKATAKRLNVPVIALSQLNRAVEARMDKEPQLSDLRESGSIEQDADVVTFIHRPEYYDIDIYRNTQTAGLAWLLTKKHRNGPTGTCKLLFDSKYVEFKNYNQIDQFVKREDLPV